MTAYAGDTLPLDDVPLRFERLWRLVGSQAMKRLEATHVVVVGLGGVGSFAAEALARSGIGHITLVDHDRVCITNTNRQLHALRSTVGQPKASLMAERLEAINPRAHISAVVERCDDSLVADLVSNREHGHWVADCIDQVPAKVAIIAHCHRHRIPLVTSLGAAARLDPTRVRVTDLGRTHTDPLGKMVRKMLRSVHGIRWEGELGIPAVFSDERPAVPRVPEPLRTIGLEALRGAGTRQPARPRLLGSAVFVTAVFGMTVASVIGGRVSEGE